MQAVRARARRRRQRRTARVLLLGFSLGLLQSLLLLGCVLLQPQWPFSWVAFLVVSGLFSLAIPALDGFLAARQNEDTSSGFGPGCLVGGIGFLIIAILTSLLIPLALQHPCAPPEGCNWGGAIMASAALQEAIIILWFAEGMSAVIGGSVGGWLGGLLGKRSRPAAGDLPAKN
jgi:hypothetical protein